MCLDLQIRLGVKTGFVWQFIKVGMVLLDKGKELFPVSLEPTFIVEVVDLGEVDAFVM